jgi:hypothetical protein
MAADPPERGRDESLVQNGARPVKDVLPLPMRIAAWIVAIPLALAIVGLPARKGGYLTSQKLLDVIVKHDMGRFVPLAVIVVLWAIVTTVFVTVLVEGGRVIRRRRRGRRFPPVVAGPLVSGPSTVSAGVSISGPPSSGSGPAVPPPRRRAR